jgi:uncharacterized protein YndB with AHSA1/START domain
MKQVGKLELTVPSDREVVLIRELDAPRELVFQAFTDPELLKKWLFGPPGWTLAVCQVDLRPGGVLRYVWRGQQGEEMGLRGVFREVVPPERLVHTEIFDQDWTGGETLVTTTMTECNGKTSVRMSIQYASRAGRDMALSTPMAEGMEMGYERLDALLSTSSA